MLNIKSKGPNIWLLESIVGVLLLVTVSCAKKPTWVSVYFHNQEHETFIVETNFPRMDTDERPASYTISSESSLRIYGGALFNAEEFDVFCNYICKDYPDASVTIYHYDEASDSKGDMLLSCPLRELENNLLIYSYVCCNPDGNLAKHIINWKMALKP